MRSILLLLFVFSGYLAQAQYYTEEKSFFIGVGASSHSFAGEDVSYSLIEGGIGETALSLGTGSVRSTGVEVIVGTTIFRHRGHDIIKVLAKYGTVSYTDHNPEFIFETIDFNHNIEATEFGGILQFHFSKILNNYDTQVWSIYLPVAYMNTSIESEFQLRGEFNHEEKVGDDLFRNFETSGGSYGFGLGVELYASKRLQFNAEYIDYKELIDDGRISFSARYYF